MYLKAISTGVAVPHTDFDATVHSVFRSAVNLQLARGGKLLTLVTASEADLPQGLRVNTPHDFSFEIFHAGEQVTCRDHILCLNLLTIELRDARLWKCDLPALRVDLNDPAVLTSWQCVWQMLNERQRRSHAEIIAQDLFCLDKMPPAGVSRKMGEAISNLVAAARHYDLTNASSVCTLIGLGAGLTPSGDDFLVGYLAGLWCSVLDKGERVQFVASLGKAVTHFQQRTNDISRSYLQCAVQGQVSSRLMDLAELICRGENSGRLSAAAESALQVGHTSGMDTVTGLLIGLAVWEVPAILNRPLLVFAPESASLI
jgi:hypothetical protein